jgi:hypothetical protein
MNNQEYQIFIKPVDEDHVNEKLQARYMNPLYQQSKFDFQDVYSEIMNSLKTAIVDHNKRENNPNRCETCRNNKKVVKNYSKLLNMEIKGVVFQDDKNNARYLLTLLENSMVSAIQGFPV